MSCLVPISAWYTRQRHPTGGRIISFGKHAFVDTDELIHLPCGRCIGCRLERARQWAVRLMHETKTQERASFLTLTYDENHLPQNNSLSVEDTQLFFKKLRKWSDCERRSPIRYFVCGEYGEHTARPHYHVILFGEDFAETRTHYKNNLYTSPDLEKLWGKGFAPIGSVTFDSACYVASYCTKKITGPSAPEHYGKRLPEFGNSSRRPGIGSTFFQKYWRDIYPSDEVIINGLSSKPPRFYDKLLAKQNPQLWKQVHEKRLQEAPQELSPEWFESLSYRRLGAKDSILKAQFKMKRKEL